MTILDRLISYYRTWQVGHLYLLSFSAQISHDPAMLTRFLKKWQKEMIRSLEKETFKLQQAVNAHALSPRAFTMSLLRRFKATDLFEFNNVYVVRLTIFLSAILLHTEIKETLTLWNDRNLDVLTETVRSLDLFCNVFYIRILMLGFRDLVQYLVLSSVLGTVAWFILCPNVARRSSYGLW